MLRVENMSNGKNEEQGQREEMLKDEVEGMKLK